MNIPELISQVQNGDTDPLAVALALKDLEDQLKAAKNILKPIIVDHLAKYPKSQALFSGFNFRVQNKSVYDYSTCGDIVWDDCNEKLESIKLLMEDREAFLKSLKEPFLLVSTEGEEFGKIMPPKVKPSENYYVITKNGKN